MIRPRVKCIPASLVRYEISPRGYEALCAAGRAKRVFYISVNDIFLRNFLSPERIQLWYGGSGAGKSDAKATEMLFKALTQPYFRLLYVRKFKEQVRQSQFQLFKDLISRYHLQEFFDINVDMYIRCTLNGNLFFPGGLDDVDKLKSIPDITDIWIEEPIDRKGSVKLADFTELDRRLRTDKAPNHLHLTFNPVSQKSWVYRVFFGENLYSANKLKATYKDNYFISGSEFEKFETLKRINYAEYQVYGEGEWGGEMDEYRLFSDEAVDDLFTNSFIAPDLSSKYITADIALQGKDRFVVMVWYGWVVVETITIEKSDGPKIVSTIQNIARQHGVPGSRVAFDAGGIGSPLSGYLRGALPFVGAARALEDKKLSEKQRRVVGRPTFKNLRAQAYYWAAQSTEQRTVFFSTKSIYLRESLSSELSAIQRVPTPDGGAYQIIKKEAIIGAIGRSPDYADCYSMRWLFEFERPAQHQERKIITR